MNTLVHDLIVLILSAMLTAISLFWKVELFQKKGNTDKVVKGIVALILLVGLIIVASDQYVTAKSKQVAQTKAENSRDSLQRVINIQARNINANLRSGFDTTGIQLHEIIGETSTLATKAKQILKVNDTLYAQINRLNKLQSQSIRGNGPNVQIVDKVNWFKSPYKDYLLDVLLTNLGKTETKDLTLGLVFISTTVNEIDRSRKMAGWKMETDTLMGVINLPPGKAYHLQFEHLTKNDTTQTGFAFIYFQYTNLVTAEKVSEQNLFVYNTAKLDGLNFTDTNGVEKTTILKYIKQNISLRRLKLKMTNNEEYRLK